MHFRAGYRIANMREDSTCFSYRRSKGALAHRTLKSRKLATKHFEFQKKFNLNFRLREIHLELFHSREILLVASKAKIAIRSLVRNRV